MTCCCSEHAGAFEMLDRTCPNCPEHHAENNVERLGLDPGLLRRQADFLDGKGSESTASSLRQRAEIIELKRLLEEAYGLILAVDTVEVLEYKLGTAMKVKHPDMPEDWFDKTNDLLGRLREVLWP